MTMFREPGPTSHDSRTVLSFSENFTAVSSSACNALTSKSAFPRTRPRSAAAGEHDPAGFGELGRVQNGAAQRGAQETGVDRKPFPVDVDLSQQQSIIQYRENSPAGSFKHILGVRCSLRGRHFFQNELADTEKSVEWRAELVRDEVQELVLGTIEDGQPLVCFGKFTRARGDSLLQAFILRLQFPLQVMQLEMRFDAGVNFFELEGLGYVVHRTGPESLHLVFGFVQGAEKNDGNAGNAGLDLRRSHTS